MKGNMQYTKHNIIAEYTNKAENDGVGQEFTHDGGHHVSFCYGKPVVSGAKLDFTTYAVHRDEQYEYLKLYNKVGLTQVKRVVQRRVVYMMIICLHREEVFFYLLFVNS